MKREAGGNALGVAPGTKWNSSSTLQGSHRWLASHLYDPFGVGLFPHRSPGALPLAIPVDPLRGSLVISMMHFILTEQHWDLPAISDKSLLAPPNHTPAALSLQAQIATHGPFGWPSRLVLTFG